jgi:hypothetical protein
MTRKSQWKRRRSAFDCSGIEEEEEEEEEEKEEEDEKVLEFLQSRRCEKSGLKILALKEYVF